LSAAFLTGVNAYAEENKVVVLMSSDAESFKHVLDGFKEQIASKNPSTLVTSITLKGIEATAAVSQVLAAKPDVIVSVGEDATKLMKENIKDKQIVFCMIFNTQNYTEQNITGVSLEIRPDMKLQELKKIYPAVKKTGVLYSANSLMSYAELNAEAPNQGLTIIAKKIENDSDFPGALKDVSSQTDCFLMVADPKVYFSQTIKYLLLESLRNKFPVLGLSSFYTKAGAFASFECDYKDLGRQSADITAKLFSGQRASDIKIQRPRKLKYSISALVADKMQIKIPEQVLREASEVFN